MVRRVLVVASTFPANDEDHVPAFVRDQVVAMQALDPDVEWHVLAPHDRRSQTRTVRRWPSFVEHRFHYMWPRRLERLAGRGIMPALRAEPHLHVVLPFFFLAEFWALWRLARSLRPDVLYAHWFTPQAITSVWVARLVGSRTVFTTHASDVAVWHRFGPLGAAVVRWHVRRAAAFTAVSRRSMGRLRQFFPGEAWAEVADRGRVLPMGVHVDAADETPPADGTVLFIGRLVEKKGVSFLLRAFAEAGPELGDVRLVVAGDGPLRSALTAEAVELGLGGRVEFPGYVTGEAKADLVRSAAVVVVPSVVASDGDVEGLPIALLEGLAAGRPCVATPESGADDVLEDGVNGFLVPQRDSTALAAALVRAVHLSPSERSLIGERARTTARRLAWPVVARQHLDLLFDGAPPA
ncbi:glycosyltransferase [Cellulomonas telluris]|uniref:glycosyltransferase n=1 Tax=Cellulomonas telluris TaxID=2306636 RepID=UPI0010A86C92|nr:glycosyltransferase [Cellulomonas telluris]